MQAPDSRETQVKLRFPKIGIRHLKPACFTKCRALFRTANKWLQGRFQPSGGSGPDAPPRGRPPRHRMAPQRPSDSLFQLIFVNSYFPCKSLRLSRKIPCGRTHFFGTRESKFNPAKTSKCACCKIMLNPPVKTPANQSPFHNIYQEMCKYTL